MSKTMHAMAFTAMLIAAADRSLADDRSTEISFFETRIRPLLVDHCYDCHGPDEAAAKLRLDFRSGWQRGGEPSGVLRHD